MNIKLRFVDPWSVVRLADGTPAITTETEKRGFRMVSLAPDYGRWVHKDEVVEVLRWPAELAHDYLARLGHEIAA